MGPAVADQGARWQRIAAGGDPGGETPDAGAAPDREVVLAVQGLSHEYGDGPVLRGVELQVRAGEIVALLGRDGAGKSTLLRCAAGWTRPAEGETYVLGRRVARADRRTRAYVVLVPDTPVFWDDLTLAEHLQFVAQAHRRPPSDWRPEAEGLLARLGLAGRADGLPGAGARGLRQKAALAMALVAQPRVLLLDEPLAPLDPASARDCWALLRERAAGGLAVLMACNGLPPGAVPDRYAVLAHGRVAAGGTPGELARRFGLAEVSPETLLALTAGPPVSGGAPGHG